MSPLNFRVGVSWRFRPFETQWGMTSWQSARPGRSRQIFKSRLRKDAPISGQCRHGKRFVMASTMFMCSSAAWSVAIHLNASWLLEEKHGELLRGSRMIKGKAGDGFSPVSTLPRSTPQGERRNAGRRPGRSGDSSLGRIRSFAAPNCYRAVTGIPDGRRNGSTY